MRLPTNSKHSARLASSCMLVLSASTTYPRSSLPPGCPPTLIILLSYLPPPHSEMPRNASLRSAIKSTSSTQGHDKRSGIKSVFLTHRWRGVRNPLPLWAGIQTRLQLLQTSMNVINAEHPLKELYYSLRITSLLLPVARLLCFRPTWNRKLLTSFSTLSHNPCSISKSAT